MKRITLLFNSYLSNFWFVLLLLTISGFIIIFFDPIRAAAFSFGINGEFALISLVLWRFWVLFLLPLAVISILLAVTIWFRDKEGNNYRGFTTLVIILLTLGFLFLLISKLLILDQEIRNHTMVFRNTIEQKQKLSPSLSELELIERDIDKSNWQTYSNAQYNFEIKGPESWTIKPQVEADLMESFGVDGPFGNFLSFQPKDNDDFYAPMSMYIENNPDNLSIIDWMSKKDSRNDSKWQENMFRLDIPTTDDSAAFYIPLGTKGIYHYVIKKGDKIFSFDLVDSQEDVTKGDAMMSAIVKTLRFK